MMNAQTMLLQDFDAKTIERSREYLSLVKNISSAIPRNSSVMVVKAMVIGNKRYQTSVSIHVSQITQLVSTKCSCPVRDLCKHAAALVQVAHQQGLLLNPTTLSSLPQNKSNIIDVPVNKHPKNRVNDWFAQLDQYAKLVDQPIRKSNDPVAPAFIYVMYQTSQRMLCIKVFKVEHNHLGDVIRVTPLSHIRSYDFSNVTDHTERELLFRLASHRQQYSSIDGIVLEGMSQSLLQALIATQQLYWQTHQQSALSWSTRCYQLTFDWQTTPDVDQDQLSLQAIWTHDVEGMINQTETLINPPKYWVIPTTPPCYIDVKQGCIGALQSPYHGQLLTTLTNAPTIPASMFDQLADTLFKHQQIKLPQPAVLDRPIIAGEPQAVLRFGLPPDDLRSTLEQQNWIAAAIRFDYAAGSVLASDPREKFSAKHEGQSVIQQRNLAYERKIIKKLTTESTPQLLHQSYLLSAHHRKTIAKHWLVNRAEQWLALLLKDDVLSQLGWVVEYDQHSPFRIQQMQRPDIQLLQQDAAAQIDWFELGMHVTAADGQQYDFVELLEHLVQRHPELLKAGFLDGYADDEPLILIGPDQQVMMFKVSDLRPILNHLMGLMSRDRGSLGLKLDQFDAIHLLDLQHVLGFQWAGSEHLKQLYQQIKQGYEQKLATPEGFVGELRGYQQQGLAWLQFLRQTDHAGILADDMGLGKTAQTLAHLQIEKNQQRLDRPTLIVAPTSLMGNWRREIEKFTPNLRVLTLHGQHRHQSFEQIDQHDVVLTTYALLSRDEATLSQHAYHMVILDEAQNIKNPKTKAAQMLRQLNTRHRLCLTGTPIENHLGELWSLYHFLMPGFLGDQAQFNRQFRSPIEKENKQYVQQGLAARVKPFMLRRRKTDVAKELPAKTVIDVKIEMTTDQQKLYQAVRVGMQANIVSKIASKGFSRSHIEILDALLKLRQVCCHPSLLKLDDVDTSATSAKLETLIDMVLEMVEEGRRILIFSQFTSMLAIIEARLKQAKIASVKLTGQTKKRDEVVATFQQGDTPVFLISLKAGGTGLNLTTADTVIHYDPWWNPAAEEQAADRAWRIGQKNPVFVYKLITSDSIEEKIMLLQQRKTQLTQGILSDDNEQTIKFNESDLMALLDG